MNTIPEYTLVIGVDEKHLKQLQMVWPTWVKHKNGIQTAPVIFFFDRDSLDRQAVACAASELDCRVERIVEWPTEPTDYGQGTSKWDNPQRHKMLAGFCHVAGKYLETPYFLKLDTDVVGLKEPECRDWILPEWFKDNPAIIAPPWSYTRPKEQMLELDQWGNKYHIFTPEQPPLNLVPDPVANKLSHPRIGGWCNFFSRSLARFCWLTARDTVGPYKMPVPSYDGFTWYCATRLKLPVVRVSMKNQGWGFWHTMDNIQKAAERSLL